jgi:hypothetical protein
MNPARSQYIIDVGLFEQRGGWVFVAVKHGHGFYNDILFSGKRKSLQLAMSAAKQLAGDDVGLLYSRLDRVLY